MNKNEHLYLESQVLQEKPSTVILLRLISATNIDPQANLGDKQRCKFQRRVHTQFVHI